MDNVSKMISYISRGVVFPILFLEIILIVSIILIYHKNTDKIRDDMQVNIDQTIEKYKEFYESYLQDKYYMMSEDLVLMLKTFESTLISSNYKNTTDLEKCVFNGNDIFNFDNKSDYKISWYKNTNLNNISRLKGTWFTTRDNLNYSNLKESEKNYAKTFCSIERMLKNTLLKHLEWEKKTNITIESFYFVLNNSFFIKYPAYLNEYMSSNDSYDDTSRVENCTFTTDFSRYEPKCPFFKFNETNNTANIIISPTYLFPSSQIYGKL